MHTEKDFTRLKIVAHPSLMVHYGIFECKQLRFRTENNNTVSCIK